MTDSKRVSLIPQEKTPVVEVSPGQENEEPSKEEKQDDNKKASKSNTCVKIKSWVFKLTAFIVALAVVGMCFASAIFSILKLIQTKDMPVSTYQQRLQAGSYEAPGLIFVGVDLMLHDCKSLNFTSLYTEDMDSNEDCGTITIALDSNDGVSSGVMETLPSFMQTLDEDLMAILIKGPSNWESQDTVMTHLTVPDTRAGVWTFVHPSYQDAYEDFEQASNVDDKWQVVSNIVLIYSMNFASAQFKNFFLMTKQEFKSFGVLQTVRIDMEISLIDNNQTELDNKLEDGRKPSQYTHVETYFQWKDGYYMQGDEFIATTIWSIVTIIASALLMLERGYNTMKRVFAIKIVTNNDDKSKEDEIVQNLKDEEEELNAKHANEDDGPPDSRPSTAQSLGMLEDIYEHDDINNNDEYQNFAYQEEDDPFR